MIKLIELFAGIGTQRQAFEQFEDIDTVAISEIDPRPLNIYKNLFSTCPNLGDITKISSLPEADIWTYSFPCTDLSIAGKKEGLKGEKSGLIYEVLRLLKNSPKPKILVMENVSNLVSKNFMPGFEEWMSFLADEGYKTFWKKMKASDYGGLSIRNRVFAVSVLQDKDFIFPKKRTSEKVVRDILQSPLSQYFVSDYSFIKKNKNFENAIKIADFNNGGQGNRIYSIDGKGITLTATGGGKGGSSGLYLREEGIYKLSGIEMCLLMGWDISKAKIIEEVASYRDIGFVMGNGIDLKVFSLLAESIISQYFS